MNKISKQAIEKITQTQLKQIPKSYFLALNFIVAISTFIFLSLGALAISSFIYSSDPAGFQLLLRSKPGISKIPLMIQQLLPISWIITILITTIISALLLRKSKLNYKLDYTKILALFLIPQIILGLILFKVSIPQRIDQRLGELGIKNQQRIKKENLWFAPQDGRWVGIIKMKEDKYTLIDPSRKTWELIFSEEPTNLKTNDHIRLKGQKSENQIQVEAWQPLPNKFKTPPNGLLPNRK